MGTDTGGSDWQGGDRHERRVTIQEHEQPSTAVVRAIESVREDPLPYGVLYDCIDTDALDRLFAGRESVSGPRSVSFSMAGCRVCVVDDRHVIVRRAESESTDTPTVFTPETGTTESGEE